MGRHGDHLFVRPPPTLRITCMTVKVCKSVLSTYGTLWVDHQCEVLLFVLKHNLRQVLRKILKNFLQNQQIILHDNSLAHTAQIVTDVFASLGWEVLYYHSYSPNSQCYFYLISKMNKPLRDICFHTAPEILQALDRSIQRINKTSDSNGIPQLTRHWKRVLDNENFCNFE